MKFLALTSILIVSLAVLFLRQPSAPNETFQKNVPTFSLMNIEGITDIFQAVENINVGTRRGVFLQQGNSIRAVVLPHHTLLGKELATFWKEIAESTKPSTIVIVGPAHENQGSRLLQSTYGTWETPFGNVQTNNVLVSKLLESGVVFLENASFENEHSVGAHMPYIAKLFEDVKVLPVLAQAPAKEFEARRLVNDLLRITPKDTLFVFSIDFSHYLTLEQSRLKDQKTLELIEKRVFHQIDGLSTDHLDSPFSLEAFLILTDALESHEELIWHENSGNLYTNPKAPTTSYFVFYTLDKFD